MQRARERFGLTDRQSLIVEMFVHAATRADIIDRLEVAPSTYDCHARAIREKTGMSVTQVAIWVLHVAASQA